MARRSNVPKFGEWENGGNVPYTVYFDEARKNRGTEKPTHADPNNPAHLREPGFPKEQEKRVQRGAGSAWPNQPPEPMGRGANRGITAETGRNWEPSRSNHGQRRPNNEPSSHGKAKQQNEHSIEASPLHRNQHGRAGAGGNNGMSSHHQGSTGHGVAPLTPGRARPKQVIRSINDPDDYGSAVPKFGGWEDNPESDENYTEKFNKFIKDKQNGAVVAPTPTGYNHKRDGHKSPKKGFSCFPCLRK